MCKESPKYGCLVPALFYFAECSSVPWSRCHDSLCSSLTSSRGQEQSKHLSDTAGAHSVPSPSAELSLRGRGSLKLPGSSEHLGLPFEAPPFKSQGTLEVSFVSSLLIKFKCPCWILYFLLTDLSLPCPQNEDSHNFATIFNTSWLPVSHCQLRPIIHVTALPPYPPALAFPALESVFPTQTMEAII